MSPLAPRQLQELVQSHGAALVLYARQWCSCPDDALQEALIDLALQQLAPRDPVGWLFKAVRFKAINLSRAQRRRNQYENAAAQQRDNWFERDPIDAVQSSELEAMLTELEPTNREIVVARIWGGMSFEQIAELVDSSISTVHRRYQQTLKQLEMKLNGTVKKR